MTTFTAETYQNEYLAEGATEVNADRHRDGDRQRRAARSTARCSAAVIVIVDTSGSMGVPGAKHQGGPGGDVRGDRLHPRRRRVRGDRRHRRRRVASTRPDRRLAIAGAGRRGRRAKQAVDRLKAAGRHGDRRLAHARQRAVRPRPGTRSATRSCSPTARTSTRPPSELGAVLARCEGRFQCDCRGVGTDWEVDELRQIASALLGSVDIVADAGDLAADFTRDDRRRDGQGDAATSRCASGRRRERRSRSSGRSRRRSRT